MDEISVVIPVYNEQKIIRANLDKIVKYLNKKIAKYELIVVNDGSQDETNEEIRKLSGGNIHLISYKQNRGKGYAVKQGVLSAKYDNILFMDADLATPIETIEKLTPFIKDFDMVIASRALPESKIEHSQPFLRRTFGAIGKKIIGFFLVKNIKDTQCGFKLFKKKAAIELFNRQKINRWGFDFEILFMAQKQGYKIKEVPIVWYAMQDSKLKFTDYIITLWDLIKLKTRSILLHK